MSRTVDPTSSARDASNAESIALVEEFVATHISDEIKKFLKNVITGDETANLAQIEHFIELMNARRIPKLSNWQLEGLRRAAVDEDAAKLSLAKRKLKIPPCSADIIA